MSRVFLARDLSLGGKQVVLKVTLDRGQEPTVQGPLDHPHIVPVNSVVYQKDSELCGLSMPYRPGLTLDAVMERVSPSSLPRKAMNLWTTLISSTLQRSAATELDGGESDALEHAGIVGPHGDGWQGFPVRGSYAQGVAWIVMIYARALHYAHRKQTFHRDVKPANMLLTVQNGPQLLDFNLAESPHTANQAQAALHGGTLAYMAPEQIEAFITPGLWGQVAAQADIYSLGLVLRELLTGHKPELPNATLTPAQALRDVLGRRPFLDIRVRPHNRTIPYALEAIVAKCLAFSPADRYQDARQLEQDLGRFLGQLPLEFATNSDRRERAINWIMRHRTTLARAAGAIALALSLTGIWNFRPSARFSHSPNIEATPRFQQAVRLFNEGNLDSAAAGLRQLERENPHSCLVKLYLGFSLKDHPQTKFDADKVLRLALSAPDRVATLSLWTEQHHEVIDALVEFADSRMMQADEDAEKFDYSGKNVSDEDRDRVVRRPPYELAKDALALAESLDPSRRRIQFLLAKTERVFGDFDRGFDRASRLINLIKAEEKPDAGLLFECYALRSWIAFLWADQDRSSARSSPTEATRNRLVQATKDLCSVANISMGTLWKASWTERKSTACGEKYTIVCTSACERC